MGLFDFFKKKKKEIKDSQESNSILLAMPMFINNQKYDLNKIINHLESFWNLSVKELTGDSSSAVFDLDGQPVALGIMNVPIPITEIDSVIDYAYLWKDARDVLSKHTNHAIVSVLSSDNSQIQRYTLLSKLLCSIMLTTPDCIGIYQGQETLLLQRDFYLSAVDDLKNGSIPVPAWVYIGLQRGDKGINAYTYGMKSFNKTDFEIIDTPLNADQLYSLILNIVSYTLERDITFNSGDTFKLSDSAKMKITTSKGIYSDDATFKLEID